MCHKNHVSAIRRGSSEVGSGTLVKLLDAMERLAPGSRLYFCLLLAGKNPDQLNMKDSLDIALLVESMNENQIQQLLYVIAANLGKSKQKKVELELTAG